MKKINRVGIVLLTALLFALTGCAKFSDGSSVWQAGTWIVPSITAIGAGVFGYLTYKNRDITKYYKNGFFYFAITCLVATIFIIANVVSNR